MEWNPFKLEPNFLVELEVKGVVVLILLLLLTEQLNITSNCRYYLYFVNSIMEHLLCAR